MGGGIRFGESKTCCDKTVEITESRNMKNVPFCFVLVLLLFSYSAWASQIPGFDLEKWNVLMHRVIHDGNQVDLSDGVVKTLSRIEPPVTTLSHEAHYVGVSGSLASEGKFYPRKIYFSSEIWERSDDLWNIDQWSYSLSVEGDLLTVFHTSLVETVDGGVIRYEDVPTGGISDPSVLERMGAMLKSWY